MTRLPCSSRRTSSLLSSGTRECWRPSASGRWATPCDCGSTPSLRGKWSHSFIQELLQGRLLFHVVWCLKVSERNREFSWLTVAPPQPCLVPGQFLLRGHWDCGRTIFHPAYFCGRLISACCLFTDTEYFWNQSIRNQKSETRVTDTRATKSSEVSVWNVKTPGRLE